MWGKSKIKLTELARAELGKNLSELSQAQESLGLLILEELKRGVGILHLIIDMTRCKVAIEEKLPILP